MKKSKNKILTAPEGPKNARQQPRRSGKRKTVSVPATPDLLKTRLMLRVKEFGELTGTATATVYALLYQGKLPGAVRIGNSWRIPVQTVREITANNAA